MALKTIARQDTDARTLYLGVNGLRRVDCTNSALVVTTTNGQVLRYPTYRLLRIVSSVRLDWSGDALAQCFRSGICISWLDGEMDEPLASAFTRKRQATGFGDALTILLESEPGLETYQTWHRSRRMQTMQAAHAVAKIASISPREWEAIRNAWVYRRRFVAHLPKTLDALCAAHCDAHLTSQGLKPVYWDYQARAIDLQQDLHQLVWAEMNMSTGTLAEHAQDPASHTELFERWSGQRPGIAAGHLHALQRIANRACFP
ncbi:MAG: hypothetical protein ORN28_07700 [Rhodoferax sp.]|nr:hypothetical protein [Rhodoferax sp.]